MGIPHKPSGSVDEQAKAFELRADQLETFVRLMPASVAMFDREMRYLAASDRWCAASQIDRNQILGHSIYEFLPDLPDRWKEIYRRALSGETLRAEQDQFNPAGGSPFHIRWEICPWGSRDGSPEGVVIFSEDITGRVESAEALRDQQNRMDKVLANVPGGVYTFRMRPDGSTSIPYANEGLRKIVPGLRDLSRDTTPLRAMVHPGDATRVDDALREAARTMSAWSGTCRMIDPARGTLWVEVHAVPEQEPDDSIAWYVFLTDVTERKRIEDIARDQRDRLDRILATTPGAICAFRLRPGGAVSLPYTSPGFKRMLPELPEMTEDARPLFAMMHPDDAARVSASVAESARTMSPWRDHYRILSPTRGTMWFEGHSMPAGEDDGSIFWYGFLSDITERKRLEEALRENESILASLFDTASQGIIGIGAAGDIRLVNRMAEKTFGYKRAELIGLPVEQLLPSHLHATHAAHRVSYNSAPKSRPMGLGPDLLGRRKDGSEFPIEVSLSHVETSKGLLAVAFLTDITVRKQAELALQASENELRRLAGTLLTAQEDERRRIARDLHDDVTQKLALLSIELGQLVKSGARSVEEIQDRLRSLQNKTSLIAGSIRHLSHALHSSVIENVGLSAALAELFEEFSDRHEIPIHFDPPPHHCALSIENASCLYRVAQEAVQNVAKHAGATFIHIALERTDDNVELTVIDDGVGLSNSRKPERTGLGVISMRERVIAVHGALTITSAPGKGTEIRASVPALVAAGR